MRKWAFLYSAAAIAVIGCGGSGNGPTVAKIKPTTKVGISIKLSNLSTPAPGAIEVAFLTGQGRLPGDLTAVVRQLRFDDSFGEVTNPLAPQTSCPLTGFQNNIVHLDVPFSTTAIGQPSRFFSSFLLDFLEFHEETDTPVAGDFTVFPTPAGFPHTYPASIRVFPGRTTSLPVFIDDSMFSIDTVNPLILDYNENQFLLANGATAANPMKAFLSDFVAFNLNGFTNAAQIPTLVATTNIAGGTQAVRVFFSGDVYAVSDGFTSGSNFEALTLDPTLPIGGVLGSAGVLVGPNGTLPHAGTYSLLQFNPTDLTQTLKIIAGQGIWREHKTVLVQPNGAPLGAGSYVVTFPSSNDNNMQEMVAFTQDAQANISSLYFGFIDMDAGNFFLFPVVDIMSGAVTGSIDGSVGPLFTSHGSVTSSPDLVRSGSYSFNTTDGSAAAAAAAGFQNGTFFVFRL